MMKKVKILLIVPPVIYARQPSIGAAYLASYLKSFGYETIVWDLNTEIQIDNDGDDSFWSQEQNCIDFYNKNHEVFDRWIKNIVIINPQIVGFTFWTTSSWFSLKISELIKQKNPGMITVFGGYLCNICGNDFINNKFIDIIVKGEGEETLLEIAKNISNHDSIKKCPGILYKNNGNIIDCGLRNEISSLDTLPFPDFSDFKLDKYLFKGHIPILFSRGCSWSCNFCTVKDSWGKYRSRSAKNIFAEILKRLDQYPGFKQFELCDCAFNQDLKMLSELCDLIISNNIKLRFSGLAQIKPEMDTKVLEKMREAGFILCNFGIESGSDSVLKSMGKQYNASQAEEVIRNTSKAGIDVVLNFIVGYPTETRDDFYKTLEFIDRIKDSISNTAPAHACDIEHAYIEKNAGAFGINYPDGQINLWRTKDGKNTHQERSNRAKLFDDYLKNLNIKLKCGFNDREEMKEKTL